MNTFTLMRHAKTRWNIEKKIQGSTDTPLCRKGEFQAQQWAKKMSDFRFAKILSSPMKRAVQTSAILAGELNLDIEVVPQLREQDFGQWEGEKISDLRNRFPGQVEALENLGWEFCPPEGESRNQVLKRAAAALLSIDEQPGESGDHCLVVCHSSVIKCLVYHALGMDFSPNREKVLEPYHLHQLKLQQDGKKNHTGVFVVKQVNFLNLEEDAVR